jgi:hypothetical protein
VSDGGFPDITLPTIIYAENVSIRDTIDGLLANESDQTAFRNNRASFLEERELGDIPDELIDTAFVHYADTTSLDNADVLAPVVTRVGPVPLEETDLSDAVTNELGEGEAPDPWSMVEFAETALPAEAHDEADPADLDNTMDPEELTEVNFADGPQFGSGGSAMTGDDASSFDDDQSDDEPLDEDLTAPGHMDSSLRTIEQAPEAPVDMAFDDVDDYNLSDSENVDEDDIDPMDLDLD